MLCSRTVISCSILTNLLRNLTVCQLQIYITVTDTCTHTYTTILRPFSRDYSGEPVPEESFFWTLWCKGRYQRQTHQQSGWAPLHADSSAIHLPHLPVFTPVPFLSRPSQFILAWVTHQICWLAYPVACENISLVLHWLETKTVAQGQHHCRLLQIATSVAEVAGSG